MNLCDFLLLAIEPRYEATGWQALLADPSWALSLVVLSLVAGCVTIYSAWREQTALHRGRWKWLALLRLLALVGVGCLLAGWQRRPVTEQIEPSRVVLLTDGSTSMGFVNDYSAESKSKEAIAAETRTQVAKRLIPTLVERFSESHQVIEARFGSVVAYKNPLGQATGSDSFSEDSNFSSSSSANAPLPSVASDQPMLNEQVEERDNFYAPRDAETRIGEALENIYNDYKSTPLAAVVLLTDGRSTGGVAAERVAEEFAERGILIHTVGLGPKVEPKQAQVLGVSIPRRVFAGDPFEATAKLSAQGGFEGNVQLELLLVEETTESEELIRSELISFTKETPIVVKRFKIESPPPGRYQLVARLSALGVSSTTVGSFESVDQKTSVLLLASGPLRDYRFLRDQLFRDDSFSVDAYLQSASSGITQDVRALLDRFPTNREQLDAYDVIVAQDANWEEIGDESQQLIQQWVLKKGGGLLIVKGASFASQLVEQSPETPVGSLLPVQFLDDPLTLAIDSSARSLPLPIQITEAGEQADFMQLSNEFASNSEAWQQLKGFYDKPLEVETKLGATTYAKLGEPDGTSQEGAALLVDQYYGAGRVAYLATAEIWRMRSIDPNWFTAFYTRLLRHLAKGRVKGSAAAGLLFFDRDKYQVGQTMSVRLTGFNSSGKNPNRELIANWLLPSGKLVASPMQPVIGQANSFRSLKPIEEPGEYRIQVKLPLFEQPLVATATAILPPLESANQTRDETFLKQLSQRTSAIYCAGASDALSLIEQTPSQSEVRLILGEVDQEYSSRMARYNLCVVIALLTLEWLLRRLWRLA